MGWGKSSALPSAVKSSFAVAIWQSENTQSAKTEPKIKIEKVTWAALRQSHRIIVMSGMGAARAAR
jgi:hypothetical protein